MFKHLLMVAVHRIRGSHAFPDVFKSIEDMDEKTAEGWLRLLQNLDSDANADGHRNGRNSIARMM